MPPFKSLSIDEAMWSIADFGFTRPIRSIDVHHTWRPNHAQYAGHASIVGMHIYHTRILGWSDIGQHWSIGPDGTIWTGRDLNRLPCSQTNFNTGALMFEMIGDFDAGHDVLEGAQLDAALSICAAVLYRFRLPMRAVRFHRQLHLPNDPPPKTCPGTSIDYDQFMHAVADMAMRQYGWDMDRVQHVAFMATPDDEGSGHDMQVAADFDINNYLQDIA